MNTLYINLMLNGNKNSAALEEEETIIEILNIFEVLSN